MLMHIDSTLILGNVISIFVTSEFTLNRNQAYISVIAPRQSFKVSSEAFVSG